MEWKRFRVSDCVKAIEKAEAIANRDFTEKPWKTVANADR